MVVYKITNMINGKIYIGQSKNNDKWYFGSGILIKNAIKKYKKENFKKEVLEYCPNISILNEREIFWIDKLNSTNRKIGYNLSKGGEEGDRKKGHKIAKEGIYNYWVEKYGKDIADEKLEKKKEKLRKIAKKRKEDGWHHTEETKKIISESSKNRVVSESTREKLSISHKGKPRTYVVIFNEEAREKIRIKATGRIMKEEIKEKIRNKLKGKYFGNKNKPFTIDNIRYESTKRASDILNIKECTIKYRLKSKSKKFINYVYVEK